MSETRMLAPGTRLWLVSLLCATAVLFTSAVAGASGGGDAVAVGDKPALAASSCGSVLIDSLGTISFWAVNLRGSAMSCTQARREVRRGGVGAHGYQRYSGWVCTDTRLSYRCKKGRQAFFFKLVSRSR